MKFIFNFLIIFFFPIISYCNPVLDSLLNKLEVVENEEKADVLVELSWALKYSDIKEAEEYANKGLGLAKKLDYQKGVAEAYYKLAVVNSIQNNFDVSNQNLTDAIRVFRSLNDAKRVANCWVTTGINARKKGDYELSLSKYYEALLIFQTLKDTASILKTEGNIANIYYVKGSFKEALLTYEKLIESYSQIGDMEGVARNSGNAARSYSKQGNYVMALECFYNTNTILDSLGQTYEKANNLNSIGLIFFHLDMIPEAIETYHKALHLIQDHKSTKRKSDVFNNLGNCYFEIGDLKKAKEYYTKALEICKELNLKSSSTILLGFSKIAIENKNYEEAEKYLQEVTEIDEGLQNKINIAHVFYQKGFISYAKKKPDAAVSNLEEALSLWQELGLLPKIEATANLLVKVYRDRGEYDSAFKTQDLLNQTLDSLASVNKQSLLFQALVRDKIKKIDQINSASTKEQKTPRSTGRSFLFPLLFLMLVLVGSYFFFKKKRKETKTAESTIQESKSTDQSTLVSNTFLKKIDSIIYENIQNPNFNVAQLTRELQTNRSQLNIKLKKAAGISPSKYIQKIRLEKSIELLRDKELTIAEIAVQTGYDANYFARVFKQVYGLSPKQYRETHFNSF